MDSKQRNNLFDIIRGILIIMVVWGHCNLPGTTFIYLFHMSCFIIVSGYFYKAKATTYKDLIIEVGKKVKKSWIQYVVPVVGITIAFYFIKKIFPWVTIGNYDFWSTYFPGGLVKRVIAELLMIQAGPFTGQMWFVRNLLIVSVFFLCADFALSRLRCGEMVRSLIHLTIGLALMVLGYFLWFRFESKPIFYNVERAMMSYLIYYLGVLRKEYTKVANVYSALAAVFLLTFVLRRYGTVYLITAQIINPVCFIAVSLSGWIVVELSATLLGRLSYFSRALAYLGKNSYSIFTFHFLTMWVYDVLTDFSGIGIARLAAGLFVPILFVYFGERVIKKYMTPQSTTYTNRQS